MTIERIFPDKPVLFKAIIFKDQDPNNFLDTIEQKCELVYYDIYKDDYYTDKVYSFRLIDSDVIVPIDKSNCLFGRSFFDDNNDFPWSCNIVYLDFEPF